MKMQLLCTFIKKKEFQDVIKNITDNYSIVNNKIYIYENLQNKREFICTYNIDTSNNVKHLDDTISIHRKKESNTFYTINALNSLVKNANNGVLDKNFKINWDNYKDILILSDEDNVRLVEIKYKNFIQLIEKKDIH